MLILRCVCGGGGVARPIRNKLDIVQTDVVDDPTLQRSKNAICEKCNYNEAVFFQADEVRCPMIGAYCYCERLRSDVDCVMRTWHYSGTRHVHSLLSYHSVPCSAAALNACVRHLRLWCT